MEQTESGGSAVYSYEGLSVLFEKNLTTGTVTKRFYLGGLPVAEMVGSEVYYVHADALGSTVLETTASASQVFSTGYKPYGQEYSPSGVEAFTFTGKEYDSVTGLYYSMARWYDPGTGRFVSEDRYMGALADPLSQNRYVYASDNPLRYADPNGHASYSVLDETTWIGTNYVPSHLLPLANIVVGTIITFVDPLLDQFLGPLTSTAFEVIFTSVYSVPQDIVGTVGLPHDIAIGSVGAVVSEVLGLTSDILSSFWNGLSFLQQVEIIAEGAGYYGLDALTGGTLSAAATAAASVALTAGVVIYIANANSAYWAYYDSSAQSSSVMQKHGGVGYLVRLV